LIANPIPKADQIPFETIEPIVIEAVKLANEKNIIAKDLTPFILSKINQLSKGESLLANIALIKNNAKLASKIALCF
jgi:pseudouridine-5'-phosphate glycosidase